ncbi:OHCU decarboxylase superfamily domain-containing protein [Histoplasma capsulatum var. duboisii H88]|uniref:OHCU decarboxylase superfamily domain-containing protein n=1 Tax=Ajellomyces capsulatus (strain H88) TaxID=544711 RepID=A0A8A1LMV8_AJEC8|nr:OHCU decarboxylase superfamily domain-containing protein [Histoplasma capsulatum var. duboisii H88]
MPSLPAISTVPSLPQATQTQILDTLFEASMGLDTLALPLLIHQTFSSYQSLISAVGARMTALSAADSPKDREVLYSILRAHPRLGEKKQENLSELSRQEQAALNSGKEEGERGDEGRDESLKRKAEEETAELKKWNDLYEEKFPGLRYVVFVNGRGRDILMQDMQRRIERDDIEKEKEDIIKAMCDIAIDRARRLER